MSLPYFRHPSPISNQTLGLRVFSWGGEWVKRNEGGGNEPTDHNLQTGLEVGGESQTFPLNLKTGVGEVRGDWK